MGQEASHIWPERIMSPGEVIESHRQGSTSLNTWHAYADALGKVDHEIAAQQIVAASKDAGVWVIVQEFFLITPSDLEEMIESGLLCRVDFPLYDKAAKVGYSSGYMLTHKAIEILAQQYPAKRFI